MTSMVLLFLLCYGLVLLFRVAVVYEKLDIIGSYYVTVVSTLHCIYFLAVLSVSMLLVLRGLDLFNLDEALTG